MKTSTLVLIVVALGCFEASAQSVTKVQAKLECAYKPGYFNNDRYFFNQSPDSFKDKYENTFVINYAYDQVGETATFGLFTALQGQQNLDMMSIDQVDFNPRLNLKNKYAVTQVTPIAPKTVIDPLKPYIDKENFYTFNLDAFTIESEMGQMDITFHVYDKMADETSMQDYSRVYSFGAQQFITMRLADQAGKIEYYGFLCNDSGSRYFSPAIYNNNLHKRLVKARSRRLGGGGYGF